MISWAIVALVFFGLLLVPTIVGSILFFANRPGTAPRRVGGAIGMVCGSFLGVFLVMGTLLTGFSVRHHTTVHAPPINRPREILRAEPLQPPPPVSPPANTDTGLTRLTDDDTAAPADALKPPPEKVAPGSLVVSSGDKRPDWLMQNGFKDGDALYLNFASSKYSTLEEAREDASRLVRKKLAEDFQNVYRSSGNFIFELPVSDLRRIAVRKEYQDEKQHDFGNFQAPMYAVCWQVEFSPEVRTNLRHIWKAHVQESRTLTVGGTLLVITVALAGLSLFTRRRSGVMR